MQCVSVLQPVQVHVGLADRLRVKGAATRLALVRTKRQGAGHVMRFDESSDRFWIRTAAHS